MGKWYVLPNKRPTHFAVISHSDRPQEDAGCEDPPNGLNILFAARAFASTIVSFLEE